MEIEASIALPESQRLPIQKNYAPDHRLLPFHPQYFRRRVHFSTCPLGPNSIQQHTLALLTISASTRSQMAANGIWECTLFNFISHRSAIVFLLTGLQLYFSTIVFSNRLYHSGVELPIVSSPTIRKCFSKKTLILSKPLSLLWFALILILIKGEASLQINNSLFTCVFHSRLPLFPA